jgi:hypothetical protein
VGSVRVRKCNVRPCQLVIVVGPRPKSDRCCFDVRCQSAQLFDRKRRKTFGYASSRDERIGFKYFSFAEHCLPRRIRALR